VTWGALPDGWSGLSCRESLSLSVLFFSFFKMIVYLHILKFRPISPGTVQQIMPKSFYLLLQFLGTTPTNRNDIHDEIRSRLNSGNACYHSVQNLLSSRLISRNLKIKIYKTVILLVVLYGCETWALTLREEHRLRVFENKVLWKIFGPKREEDGSWRKLHNDELHSLYSSLNIFRVIKSRRMRLAGHEGGERCLQGFGWEARRQETTGKT
jgi:hypothetical protein